MNRRFPYYLIVKQNGDRILTNKEELLNKGCIAYAEKLRPKLILGKFTTDLIDALKETKPFEFNFLWGNEIAASQLTNYLKPELITLYAENDLPKLQLKLQLKKNNNGNIYPRGHRKCMERQGVRSPNRYTVLRALIIK